MNFASLFTFDMACAVISISGSLLVARYDKWSYLGWLLWLVANLAWIGWALLGTNAPVWGVAFQNALFLYSSIKGYLTCRASMRAAGAAPSFPPAASAPPAAAHHSA